MEYGTSEQGVVVMKALAANAVELAAQRHGSSLILHALSYPELTEDSELLATLEGGRALLQLAPNRHGCRVLRALSELPGNELEDVRLFLDACVDELD